MSGRAAAGFWSYAHDDDEMVEGAIVKLAGLIVREFNLLSSEPLKLFIDRREVAWGQEWRQRIDCALSETTFFIPIITPRYFTRRECLKELQEFYDKAQSCDVEEFILPILYVETEGLSEDNPEEVFALIARTQYVDWRKIRLLEPSSQEYRQAVNGLARRLLQISREVAGRQIVRELRADSDDGDDVHGGIIDIVERITEFLPDWLDAVTGDRTNTVQIEATLSKFDADTFRLRRARAPKSAIMAVQVRMGNEILPLLQRFHREATTYSSLSIQLDPLISRLARLVSAHPDSYYLVSQVRGAIDEAMEAIRADDEADGRDLECISLPEMLASMRHIGRIFQQCNAVLQAAIEQVDIGNSIVRRWDSELTASPQP